MASDIGTVQINPLYWWWRYCSRKARARGDYSRRVSGYYLRAWRISGSVNDLLSYALFRRDLGYVLPDRWFGLLESGAGRLRPRRRLLACSLLLESKKNCPSDMVIESACSELTQLPPVLYCWQQLSGAPALTQEQRKLSDVYSQQNQWRNDFSGGLMSSVRHKGICVVGNAGVMHGARLAGIIDQHDCVVRFNTFASDQTDLNDMGSKFDVWVLTPEFTIQTIPANFRGTVVLTGPEMQFRLLNWSGLLPALSHGLPLVTPPLPVWREVVSELAAPPSAGVIFLAWLRRMLGSWDGVTVAGFSALSDGGAVYHYADAKHKAASRHNWAGESALLRRWKNEGLTSLHE